MVDMNHLIEAFPKQLEEAISIGEKAKLSPSKVEIKNVLISGLGGSGIGGTLVAELNEKSASVPICVNKKYQIPAFVNENTLFIASSYSGNTEETLEALEAAMAKGAKVVIISSGGKAIEIAQQKGYDYIEVPGGFPPRTCLGYSLVQLYYVLSFYRIIPSGFKAEFENSIQLILKEKPAIQQEAKEVAKKLYGKIPVLYTLSYEAVAVRFRQQINENSKMLAWHHIIPEMNHNELVGWTGKRDELAVVVLTNDSDYFRNRKRLEVNEEIIRNCTANITHIHSKGSCDLERAIYQIHLTDWISFYLAELKQVDSMEVNVINHLKNELSKI